MKKTAIGIWLVLAATAVGQGTRPPPSNLNQIPTRNFSDLQNIPTTVAGYGITDALTSVPISRTIFLDLTGSDTTGAAGDSARPVQTLSKAITLATALTPTSTSPVQIIVGDGRFGDFTSNVTLPAFVSLSGRAEASTIFYSSTDNALILGDGTTLSNITLSGMVVGLTATTGGSLAEMRNVRVFGNIDCVYPSALSGKSSTLRAYNSTLTSTYDITNSTGNVTMEFYNCVSIVNDTGIGNPLARGLLVGGSPGSVLWIGGSITVNGSDVVTRTSGIEAGSGTITVIGAKLSVTSGSPAAPNTFDIYNGGGTVNLSNVVRPDGATLVTSGSVNQISRFAVRDNNGSDFTNFTTFRSNVGLAIGTNVQAYDADLTTWAGITPGTGVGTALAINVGGAGAVVTNSKGTDITSSSTTDLSTATSYFVNVTGTATINNFGTVTSGTRRLLKFTGTGTITNSSAIVLNGVNKTRSANDYAEFESLGSGNWRCVWYMDTNGRTLGAPNQDLNTDSDPQFHSVQVGTPLARVGGTIFTHFTDISTTDTDGTEDDLYVDTLVASTLGANGDSIDEMEHVSFVSSVTAARRLKKYFGGTLIFDSGALTLSAGGQFTLHTTVIRETSSVVRCDVEVSSTAASPVPYSTFTRITGLTLSATQDLKTTGIASGTGAASADIVDKLAKITWFPTP